MSKFWKPAIKLNQIRVRHWLNRHNEHFNLYYPCVTFEIVAINEDHEKSYCMTGGVRRISEREFEVRLVRYNIFDFPFRYIIKPKYVIINNEPFYLFDDEQNRLCNFAKTYRGSVARILWKKYERMGFKRQ